MSGDYLARMAVSLPLRKSVWLEKRGVILRLRMEAGALNSDRCLNKMDLTAPKSVISFETKRHSGSAARHNVVVIRAVKLARREGAVDLRAAVTWIARDAALIGKIAAAAAVNSRLKEVC